MNIFLFRAVEQNFEFLRLASNQFGCFLTFLKLNFIVLIESYSFFRKGKGKKDKKNRTEIVAPTEEDSNDVVMDGETGDASLSDFASESESDNE